MSPQGNGLDCHRTWEALILKTIPIVRTSSLDPLYEGLPVVVVHEWCVRACVRVGDFCVP